MSYTPSLRAYRFTALGRTFAVDIQNNGIAYPEGPALHLFEGTPQGWMLAYEALGPALYVTATTIAEAGGESAMCVAIVDRVNSALAKLFGAAAPAPSTTPHDAVLDRLRAAIALEVVDGVPRLSFRAI